MLRNLLPALVLPALLSTVCAQQVCVRGLVERAGPSICAIATGSHQFTCAGPLWLRSSVVNLQPHEGTVVEVCGTIQGTGSCRVMEVTTLRTGVDNLRISGPFGLGQVITFEIGQTPATAWAVLLSASRDWVDLGPLGVLTLRDPLFLLNSGIMAGPERFLATIPNDPSLVGRWLFFQSAFVPLATLAPTMGNADCFRIQ